MLGAIHLVVWLQDRKAWANLLFSVMALSVASLAGWEFGLMHLESVERFGALQRWGQVPLLLLTAGLVGFVGSYFGTARWWLAGAAVGLRLVALVLNFTVTSNLFYRAIIPLKEVPFLGDRVWVVAQGVPRDRVHVGELSALLVLVFVVDASIRLWRKGEREGRRRAVVVGGSVTLFVLIATGIASLIHAGFVQIPYLISFPFLAVVAAMSFELTLGVIRARRMAEELRESEESLRLATTAAQLALWRWDIARDVLWVNPRGRQLHGIARKETISLQRFLDAVHPDDREATQKALAQSLDGNGVLRAEYRVVSKGAVHWIGVNGRVEFNGHKPLCLRGVSRDITERKIAELEAMQHRMELSHLTRVVTLSELSGSLAHELNQPLAIILSNAQAAQRLLAQVPPDLAEVRDILADIVSEDVRAGEVIQGLRALLKRGEMTLVPLSLNEVINEVLQIISADLIRRGVSVWRDLAADLPSINGDRVQLQQVLLNLILNGADAMDAGAPDARRLQIATARHEGLASVSVRDEGCGLSEDAERLFAPFFTTKTHGLGMGLTICRSIVNAHQGRLWAEPHPERGAIFHLEIPALQASAI